AMVARSQTRPDLTAVMEPDRQGRDQIGDRLVSYMCFKNTMDTTVELLANGQIHLADACARVHDSAARNHPDYLNFIEVSDPAPTARERIARNIIGHLNSIEGDDAALSARVRTLEREL